MTKRVLSTYLDLCTQVYDLSKPTPPADAYAFYRSYALEASGPILEPMCGTGRFLIPLLADRFDMHGFDASPYMLQALHNKAKTLGVAPNVWQGFVEDLNRPDRYGLVLIPGGSFGLIVDQAKALEVLVKLREHLTDDGLLVIEAENPQAESTPTGIWQNKVWTRDDGKMITANFLDSPMQDNVSSTIWRYELVEGKQIIQTEIETIKVRSYPPDQIEALLGDSGFSNIVQVKAFEKGRLPERGDEVIVYECRK